MKHPIATLLTIGVAALIAYGTLSPPPPPGPPTLITDKHLHFAAFLLLILPLSWTNPRAALWLAPTALAYGGAIELIQPFVGRGAEWGDLLADGLGILVGLSLGLARARRPRAPESK